jgi:pimeloyl-ACP methyl ester carboxylesterase
MYYNMVFSPTTLDERIAAVSTRLFTKEWLSGHDDKYPQFTTNFDRFSAKIKPIMEQTRPVPFATIFGQGLACLGHNMTKERLQVISKEIGNIVVAAGTADAMIDYNCSKFLASAIGCELVLFPGRGHGVLEDSEVEIIEIIERQMAS